MALPAAFSPEDAAPNDCAARCAGIIHGLSYDPWQHLAEIWEPRGWQLLTDRLSDNFAGLTIFRDKTVVLDSRLLTREARSTLAHEIVHLEQGPFPSYAKAKNELIAERVAVHRLVVIDELMAAARNADSPDELAFLLDIDVDHLMLALASLTQRQHQQMLRLVNLEGMTLPTTGPVRRKIPGRYALS